MSTGSLLTGRVVSGLPCTLGLVLLGRMAGGRGTGLGLGGAGLGALPEPLPPPSMEA